MRWSAQVGVVLTHPQRTVTGGVCRGRSRRSAPWCFQQKNNTPKIPSLQTHSVSTSVLSKQNYKQKDYSLHYWGWLSPHTYLTQGSHKHKLCFCSALFSFSLDLRCTTIQGHSRSEIQETILQSWSYILRLFLQNNTNPRAFSESSLCQVQLLSTQHLSKTNRHNTLTPNTL